MTNSETYTRDTGPARKLADVLFGDRESSKLYAVLDGARITTLLDTLEELAPPSACLFAGKLDPSVARVAPYIVELERGGPFSDWLVENHWGKDAGVFMQSGTDLNGVRKHLKKFLMAKLPDGEQAFFRFYDPRVLRVYLPTCDQAEVDEFLGEAIECFLVESEGTEAVLEFTKSGAGVAVERPVER